MPKIALTQGAYSARSIIANNQRCVNLFPEKNSEDAPFPFTYYPTAGLLLKALGPIPRTYRGLFATSNGKLFGVIGPNVYFIDSTFAYTLLGTIQDLLTPVSMAENGTTLVLVDGTGAGYTINLTTNAFAIIADSNFFGGDYADFIDTFLIFNKPNTTVFYSTSSNIITPFNALLFGGKAGYPDKLLGLKVVHREIWLFGEKTTEVWSDVGSFPFPFAPIGGVFIQHGCVAKYSIATWDLATFWLSADKTGQVMVMMGMAYNALRISTYAIEYQISTYATISDAIGFIYQQQGHVFYQLTFPTADHTWVYDITSRQWSEKVSVDSSGVEHRHRANCCAFAYGKVLVGDWQNGNLYELNTGTFTDNGVPIIRRRGFPHLINDGKRVHYSSFVAEMEVGTSVGIAGAKLFPGKAFGPDFGPDFGPIFTPYPLNYPIINLRWSDNKGRSFGNPVMQSLGASGEYLTQPIWRRLGHSRDRVFELFWSTPAPVALNGAFIEPVPLGS